MKYQHRLALNVIALLCAVQTLGACIFIGTNHAERQLLRSQGDSKAGRCDKAVAEIKDAMLSSDAGERSLAYTYMASYYRQGKCVEQSYSQARYYYQKSIDLKGNWNGAAHELACMDGQSACDAWEAAARQSYSQISAPNTAPTSNSCDGIPNCSAH